MSFWVETYLHRYVRDSNRYPLGYKIIASGPMLTSKKKTAMKTSTICNHIITWGHCHILMWLQITKVQIFLFFFPYHKSWLRRIPKEVRRLATNQEPVSCLTSYLICRTASHIGETSRSDWKKTQQIVNWKGTSTRQQEGRPLRHAVCSN